MLDELRLLFLSSTHIRSRIDTATYITSSTLKAIEGKLTALGDDVREDVDTIKARTASLTVLEDIHQDVKELKNETRLLGKRILTPQSLELLSALVNAYVQPFSYRHVVW